MGDGTAQRAHSRFGEVPGDLGPPILLGRLGGERHFAFAMLDTGKDGLEPVVVGLWNGIELVVVAAGTADGEAQKRRARRAHHVVELVGSLVGGEHRVGGLHLIPGAADDESGGDVGAATVAGELGADEGVVGEIGIEALDHPVAVAPGVGTRLVHLEAVALGEADGVEPMPRPALAKARRGEEPVNEIGEGGVGAPRGHVRGEGLHIGGRRRQADKIEEKSPEECRRRSLGLDGEPLGRKRLGDEGIDRVGDPGDLRERRPDDRLEGPVRRRFFLVRKEREGERGDVVWPRGPGSHPARENRRLLRREGISVGRHPRFGVVGRDTADELARFRLPGHDPREPGVAAGERPRAIVDPPAALSRDRPVAGATAAGEERSDNGDEIE